MTNYIGDAEYDVEGFYRASKSLGPLSDWCKSILEYAAIFESIGPKREILASLQNELAVLEETMADLNAQIATLKEEKAKMTQDFQ
jgi:septal ring factor EnvC (AmiA/AmiB activator)